MLFQVKGVWFMVAKAKPSARKRVDAKLASRTCLIEGCEEPMRVCGLCRPHYDAAEHVINSQSTPELRAKARERLITQGMMLPPWKQPRPAKKDSGVKMFREAVK